MAGIGFELRKIYNEDSLFSKQKAYAYAGIVYTGPMLLGILLTAGVVVLTMVAGISENERDYILSILTYAIIFSLVITSLFSLVVTRFVADMLYEKNLRLLSFILCVECFDAYDWNATVCALSSPC
ncbi:MAG: exopolysaccharide Pel transporter PelG [Streptococcus sp.]